MIVFIEKEETASKVFSRKRFDGTYYLAKRKFKKVPIDADVGTPNKKKCEMVYNGVGKVVISTPTPIRL